MKVRRSNVDRSRVEPGVQGGLARVHTESIIPTAMAGVTGLPLLGRSSTLTTLRPRESNDLLPEPASREGISAFRRTHRRTPSPDDRGGWRIPQRNPEVDRIPCIRS